MTDKRLLVVPVFEYTYWLDKFRDYYSPFFNDIYEVPITWYEQNERYWRTWRNKIDANLRNYLRNYDVVVLLDNDEFIVPNPDCYSDLGDYLDRFKGQMARTTGYGIIEMPGDAPFDHSKSVTEQRQYWYRDRNYDKPIITRIYVDYQYGLHKCSREAAADKNLIMMHLRDADFVNLEKYCPERHPKQFADSEQTPNYKGRLAIAEPIPEKWRVI